MSSDIKNDKRLFIFRRISIIAQKLYELSKYNEKFSNFDYKTNSHRWTDGTLEMNIDDNKFIFPSEHLEAKISVYGGEFIYLSLLHKAPRDNVLKICVKKHNYAPHIIDKFEVTTTYKTAKSAYKVFRNFEKALDNELKKYYNLCIQNESLHDDFENLIGA